MNCDNSKCGKEIKEPHYRNCWGDFCNTDCARDACLHACDRIIFLGSRKKYPHLLEPTFYEGEWVGT